ncbi:hypothetical protein Tsubulata_042612 [Turnera subulata]|uniref:Pectinesterase n=1 Tax=Turnera subulata TaxID=218843 RepID=A0A9Q0JHX6_9ROSI|nr:hypothetical protein Tsubulata_042612 [Turnera subulata]
MATFVSNMLQIWSSFFVLTILSLYIPYANSSWSPGELRELPEFISPLKNAVIFAGNVTSRLSNLGSDKFLGDARSTNAIKSCSDLLSLSAHKLNLSLSLLKNPDDDGNMGSGNLKSDLRAWFNDVITDQQTCLDGLGDTKNSSVKVLTEKNLKRLGQMVDKLLDFVSPDTTISPRIRVSPQSLMDFRILKRSRESSLKPNVVVAQDGSGDFTRIMDAVNNAPDNSRQTYIIHIKQGIYREYVHVSEKKTNLMVIGDGMKNTIITGDRSFKGGWETFRSGTFTVEGDQFTAQDLTIENTAGPAKAQAVALRATSDLAAFYRCAFKGYQDTLYAHSGRQFFKSCRISGTVDFVFGFARALFIDCTLNVRPGLPNQHFYVVAAHGGQNNGNVGSYGGFVFQACKIHPDPKLLMLEKRATVYLGRPWKLYSRIVFMESYLSEIINPLGWEGMYGNEKTNTIFFAEYNNYGPGANVQGRVKWPGYYKALSPVKARQFATYGFIDGESWVRARGIPL